MTSDAVPAPPVPMEKQEQEQDLPIPNPKTPQEEFLNDIVISMRQIRDGEVFDSAESIREIGRELGISVD